eukprot:2806057-Rhodomonas_salina.1
MHGYSVFLFVIAQCGVQMYAQLSTAQRRKYEPRLASYAPSSTGRARRTHCRTPTSVLPVAMQIRARQYQE